jgi:hypothetical protein
LIEQRGYLIVTTVHFFNLTAPCKKKEKKEKEQEIQVRILHQCNHHHPHHINIIINGVI